MALASRLENGSLSSKPQTTSKISAASEILSAKIDGQSKQREFGTMPLNDTAPIVGFSPTTLLNPAGMRPEPPESVPKEKLTNPFATATADPELEPPPI
jgi:hypothetical protein